MIEIKQTLDYVKCSYCNALFLKSNDNQRFCIEKCQDTATKTNVNTTKKISEPWVPDYERWKNCKACGVLFESRDGRSEYHSKRCSIQKKEIWNEENIKKAFEEYKNLGTLEKVGERYGLTRERIRQIFNRGSQAGFFTYPIPIHTFSNEEVQECINKGFSNKEICEYLQISEHSCQELLNKNFNKDEIVKARVLRRKENLKTWYGKLVEELRSHPSTTLLQKNRELRNAYVRICRDWGTFTNFRNELGIKEGDFQLKTHDMLTWTGPGAKVYREKLQQAHEKKKQIIESIIIKAGKPINNEELLRTINDNKLINKVNVGKRAKSDIITYSVIARALRELSEEGRIKIKNLKGKTIYKTTK